MEIYFKIETTSKAREHHSKRGAVPVLTSIRCCYEQVQKSANFVSNATEYISPIFSPYSFNFIIPDFPGCASF